MGLCQAVRRMFALTPGLLLLCGCASPPPEESLCSGLQDNPLDRLFQEELADPDRSQAQLCTYQEQYDQAWRLVYEGLVSQMIAAAGESDDSAGSVLSFWAETELSWESASRALLLSWQAFRDEIPGNGAADRLKLFHGMYLRDRCMLLADWLDAGASLPEDLSFCWRDADDGFDLDAFRACLEDAGLLTGVPEAWTFALTASRLLASDWGETASAERGVQSFALWDLDGDGRRELLVSEGWYGTHYAVDRLEGDALKRVWEYIWTYSTLSVLEENILFVQNTAHQVRTFAFFRLRDGAVQLLNDLESPGDGSYWNQGQEITEAEFDAALAQYASLERLDGESGPIFWRPNSRSEVYQWPLP